MTIDHHKRADRLREFMDGCAKFNEDVLQEFNVKLDGEIPNVPFRFVAQEWDGSTSWAGFYDTVEEACEGAAGSTMGEVAWAPGAMLDLDTGNSYEPLVKVEFVPLRWAVRVSWSFTDRVDTMRFESRDAAASYIEQQLAHNDALTVLDNEPIERWEEEANDAA